MSVECAVAAPSGDAAVRPVRFVVPGAAVGKGRPRFAKRGNFVSTYTPERTANYENLVRLAAGRAMYGRALIEGPVLLEVDIAVAVPASWSQKKQREALAGELLPTTKPDADNVLKLVCDALNGVVWHDDRQVCAVAMSKTYRDVPFVSVVVSPIDVGAGELGAA